MEEHGYLTRTSTGSDKRVVLVTITPAGKRVFSKAKLLVDRITDEITSANTPEELAAIRHGLTTMRSHLLEMGL